MLPRQMGAWTVPRFDQQRRNLAGRALVSATESDEDLEVINNWRSSHSAPLQTIKMLLKMRAKHVDPQATVAQRLKRLSSIRAKLQREASMRFMQMQDVGGCRAIVKDTAALNKLVKVFIQGQAKSPKSRHVLKRQKDYVANPKADGYRSIHYVFKYQTESPALKCYNGHLIEIQLRTRLQHAWATAVEIVDAFTGQSLKTALKSRIGDARWRRFFALMGSALALREGRPPVPDTPLGQLELRRELAAVAREIDAEVILSGLGTAVSMVARPDIRRTKAQTFILLLNSGEKTVQITAYAADELEQAQQDYLSLEKRYEMARNVQVVQVAVEDVTALQTAFPNYYLDTTAFIEALGAATRKPRTRLRKRRRRRSARRESPQRPLPLE